MNDIMNINQAEIRVIIRLPGSLDRCEHYLVLSDQAADCLRPLPRHREVPWEIRDHGEAVRQIKARQEILGMVTHKIRHFIMDVVSSRDTHDGREPDRPIIPQPPQK